MSCELALIQYRDAMPDGYPFRWHHATDKCPAIKDYIRAQAGQRCQRCGHPYTKGGHPIEDTPDGPQLWSRCDDHCSHPRNRRDTRWRRLGRNNWITGVPTFADLTAMDVAGDRFEVEALWRVLTVHHLDEDKLNCRWWNLAALCQRCHLRMQRGVVMGRPYHFEHSHWFKPFAAGFYAMKYLDEDLTREEVDARMPELLALEHLFTQEALL